MSVIQAISNAFLSQAELYNDKPSTASQVQHRKQQLQAGVNMHTY